MEKTRVKGYRVLLALLTGSVGTDAAIGKNLKQIQFNILLYECTVWTDFVDRTASDGIDKELTKNRWRWDWLETVLIITILYECLAEEGGSYLNFLF